MPPDSYDKSNDAPYFIMLYIFEKNYCIHGTDKVAMIICQIAYTTEVYYGSEFIHSRHYYYLIFIPVHLACS